jgi:cytoskeletal protein RodZ
VFEIGNSLREARLRQHLELTDAEQATKIRLKYLRALEQEQFELLPSQTYVKGFLRSYADFLGLDGQLYVDEYASRYVAGEEETVFRPRRSSAGRRHPRVESNAVLLALGAIAAVTALVIAAWKFGGSNDHQAIPNLSRPPAASVLPKARTHRPSRAKPKPTTAHLVLTAVRGPCWLEVHKGSATGKQVFEGTLEPGSSQEFWSKRLWLNLGAAENLDARLNNRLVSLPSGSPAVVVVTRKGIAPASSA